MLLRWWHRVARLSPPEPPCGALFLFVPDRKVGDPTSRLVGLAVAVAISAACQKAPEEPPPPRAAPRLADAPAPPSATVLKPLAPARETGRCLDPLPPSPPPARPAGPARGCPPDPEKASPLARAEVRFPETGARVDAEIARGERDVTRGLMYRRELGEDQGMLFRLDGRRVHTFWMHNTCISLDMLFVDGDGLVVGIVENAPTLSDDIQKVACPSLYVLETNAGWTRRHGVRPGHKLVVPDLAR